MKKETLQKLLLREQSGELSPRQRRYLDCELAASEEACVLRAELGRLTDAIITPDAEPEPWTVARIDARLREERRPAWSFSKVWKMAPAMAACLAVVAGILNFHGKQTSSAPVAVVAAAGVDVWHDPFEEDLNRLENLIASISGNPLDIMEM